MSNESLDVIMQDFDGEPSDLVPVLQKVQETEGFLSDDAIQRVSQWLRISENEVYGVATFYAQFRFHPPGRHPIKVCMGTACHVRGAPQIMDSLERELGVKEGLTTSDLKFSLEGVFCLGCCGLAPVFTVGEELHGKVKQSQVKRILKKYE